MNKILTYVHDSLLGKIGLGIFLFVFCSIMVFRCPIVYYIDGALIVTYIVGFVLLDVFYEKYAQ